MRQRLGYAVRVARQQAFTPKRVAENREKFSNTRRG